MHIIGTNTAFSLLRPPNPFLKTKKQKKITPKKIKMLKILLLKFNVFAMPENIAEEKIKHKNMFR